MEEEFEDRGPFQKHRDLRLVRRLLAGEEAAFEQLADECFDALYRFALSRLQGGGRSGSAVEDLAEEAVQNTLTIALPKLGTYRGDSTLLTWLCGICRFEVSTLKRRHGAGRELALEGEAPEVLTALDALAWLAAAEDGPEEQLRRKRLVARVHETLGRLPPRYAEVLTLKYVEGLAVQEIAERLETGSKAVESALSRARLAFREAFEV